jgi:SPP1 family predicted phage head-tail adaptor
MNPRQLRHLMTFQRPVTQDDVYGGTQQSWADEFQTWGHILYLRGGESVMQARLESRQPVVITVHQNDDTMRVDSSWRVVYGSQIFNLKEHPRPNQERRPYLEVLAEA